MKKRLLNFATIIACALILTACGSKASYNVTDVVTAIDSAVKVDNPKDLVADDIQYDLGVTMENVEEFAGKTTNTNGEAGLIAVVKAKAGKANDVKAELETTRDGKADALTNYEEFAISAALTKAGRVVVKGDYVVLVIGGDKAISEKDGAEKAYESIDKAIADAFK